MNANETTSKAEKATVGSRGSMVKTVLVTSVSALVVLALASALVLFEPLPALVDQGRSADSGARRISQLNLTTYCPSRMKVADAAGFGEVKPDEGDIASSVRYAAFGPVYSSTATGLDGRKPIRLQDTDPGDDDQVQTATGNADKNASLQTTRLLKASVGAGTAAATVSWATSGDLRGVQAASCTPAAFEHDFLLPATQKGWAQQLVVFNPSTKAASVNLEAYGTKAGGALSLNTRGTVTVKAGGEATYDLAAAAPDQAGLYVHLTGSDAPVCAVVRLTSMSGNEARGSDFASEAGPPAREAFLPGVEGGDQAQLLLMSRGRAHIQAFWVTASGPVKAKEANLPGGRVGVIGLGQAPDDAVGLKVEADGPVSATAELSRSGSGGQTDFAMLSPQPPLGVGALTLPDQARGRILLLNTTARTVSAKILGFDAKGTRAGSKTVKLDADQGLGIGMDELGAGAVIARLDDSDKALSWAVRVDVEAVSKADLAGLAIVTPQSLQPRTATVSAREDRSLAR
ncbi:DUF5719 family protein [Bifidobacterium xylocopae]|uniref:Organic solvents resistance ABC transporter permease n=1 Tax=Bifidobacterium xylocopae TaxID=2493119 RepID=A0A366KFI9_9BIFI|nr:DUF5719 family protein [Bifidobacterium xylocopae]RBQ00023.1 hypothetical protein CRD59_00740 [Bifidobacterium xylocopae]